MGNMGKYLLLTFCFYGVLMYGQSEVGGIIMDADEKIPLEFVHVFNRKHSTISNTDGRFLLKQIMCMVRHVLKVLIRMNSISV